MSYYGGIIAWCGLLLAATFSSCTKEVIRRETKIFNVIPEDGEPGSFVTVSGVGFSQNNQNITIKFNDKEAKIETISDTKIIVQVPIDAGTGVVSVVVNGQEVRGPVFSYIPINWTRETENAGWIPRDSQGEVVYKDKLWIFGGWFNSYDTSFRDVWNSGDGKTWNVVNGVAPWTHSDLPMSFTFKDKMWMMGGANKSRLPDRSVSSKIWSSSDGVTWALENGSADWGPRLGAATVEFKEKMWLFGGSDNYLFGDQNSLKNDVWVSEDGKNWKLATTNAEWAPRAFHQAVVLNNKIYLMGGGNYSPSYFAFNDVWSSDDGIHWKQEIASAPWRERIWFSSVIYRNRMWIMGGWTADANTNWADVWYSADGKEWKQFHTENIWLGRHEYSAFVFHDKIWLTGGFTGTTLMNDVWSLSIPKGFFDQ